MPQPSENSQDAILKQKEEQETVETSSSSERDGEADVAEMNNKEGENKETGNDNSCE